MKALTRRAQRGTLPSETHQGRRLVRRGELERLNLIGAGSRAGGPQGVELDFYRDLYGEQKAAADELREERDQAREERDQVRLDLARLEAAIAASSGIGASRLRKRLARVRLSA